MNQRERIITKTFGGWTSPLAIGLNFAVFTLLLHFAFNSNYGYFRDELYFLACGEHLAWGYPDHAPMVALMAKASRLLLGDSLFAIRFFPAVAGAVKIFLTALLVKEFGGGKYAAFLACLCVLCAPVYLAIDNLLGMNALEPVFWMLCVYFAVRAIKIRDLKDQMPNSNPQSQIPKPKSNWLLFGTFAGLGLMNKHSMLFFGFALAVGLLLTKERKVFLNKWFWAGGLIAFLIFLPNIIWEYQNDWATLELLRNVQESGKNVVLSPPAFIFQQILMMLPVSVFVWLAGIWYFLADKHGRRFRFLGICYLVLLALMIFLKAKDYYLAPIYPMLFAAGAVWWEGKGEKAKGKRQKAKGEEELEENGKLEEKEELEENLKIKDKDAEKPDSKFLPFTFFLLPSKFLLLLKYALPILILVMGAAFLPMVVPVLPVEKLIEYQETIGFKPPKSEVGHEGVLQQIYADQFGWPEMVEQVAAVYHALPPEEREKTAIFGSNYGQAGAIDFFGAKYGLPKAISPHQSYFLWGPRSYTGESVIVLGSSLKSVEKDCQSAEIVGEVTHPLTLPYEKYPIILCRGTKKPLPEIWPSLKYWN